MIDYVSLAATAQRLIGANGRDVTLVKQDRAPADSLKPWRAGGVNDVSVGPLKAVIVPFDSDDVDGSLVRRDDKRALVAANDTGVALIEQFDILVDGADQWRIVRVSTINPGDVRVVYDMQIRR